MLGHERIALALAPAVVVDPMPQILPRNGLAMFNEMPQNLFCCAQYCAAEARLQHN